eukprot:5433681-Prymnesium_polylepis.1
MLTQYSTVSWGSGGPSHLSDTAEGQQAGAHKPGALSLGTAAPWAVQSLDHLPSYWRWQTTWAVAARAEATEPRMRLLAVLSFGQAGHGRERVVPPSEDRTTSSGRSGSERSRSDCSERISNHGYSSSRITLSRYQGRHSVARLARGPQKCMFQAMIRHVSVAYDAPCGGSGRYARPAVP